MRASRRLRRKRGGIPVVVRSNAPITVEQASEIRSHVQRAVRLGLPLIVGPQFEVLCLNSRRVSATVATGESRP